MADVKISALPASTTPLAGTEVLPIVQSGTTVKVSVANLTAGRAIGATDATLTGALSVTPTWNAGGTTFTGIGLNVTDTASASGSSLLDLQVGGASRFNVNKTGQLSACFWIALWSGTSVGSGAQSIFINPQGGTVQIASTGQFSFGNSTNAGSTQDVVLIRDAASTLAQRDGTNAQTHRIYGTFTDASNYRRLTKTMSTAGVAEIKPEGAGTGASGNVLHISGLPTSNPGPGILWNNLGIVNVGT
jgi:hypothetical protein